MRNCCFAAGFYSFYVYALIIKLLNRNVQFSLQFKIISIKDNVKLHHIYSNICALLSMASNSINMFLSTLWLKRSTDGTTTWKSNKAVFNKIYLKSYVTHCCCCLSSYDYNICKSFIIFFVVFNCSMKMSFNAIFINILFVLLLL